jgi:hypothetical protein
MGGGRWGEAEEKRGEEERQGGREKEMIWKGNEWERGERKIKYELLFASPLVRITYRRG